MDRPLVLVTGASGYLAGHLVQQLLQAGYKVRGTVRDLNNKAKIKHLPNLCPEAAENLELVEAELQKPDTWLSAVQGCEYVFHVASPLPVSNTEDEEQNTRPAVEGTMNVLRACSATRGGVGVKRVVLTSSTKAVAGLRNEQGRALTASDWTPTHEGAKTTAYIKGKTLAEKAAWDYVASLSADEHKFELVTICPSMIAGPMLNYTYGASTHTICMFLLGKFYMGLPRYAWNVVDVRDVALSHIRAMTVPQAAGKRIIVTGPSAIWVKDVNAILDEEFRSKGFPNMILHEASDTDFKTYSELDETARRLVPLLGKRVRYDDSQMIDVLGVKARPPKDTLIDMADSAIRLGFVKKVSSRM